VIDTCLEAGIIPWVTLYHWDLPLALNQAGGWTNRDIVGWFSDYVAQCVHFFGDRVKHWMVLNEPNIFTGAGYFLGVHAPGKRWLNNYLPAIHHAALAQAEGGRIIKSLMPEAEVGTTFSCAYIEPYRNTAKDIAAAQRVDILFNRMFVDPLFGRFYPFNSLRALQKIEKYVKQGDEASLTFDFDFIGIQNYTREIVKYSPLIPYIQANIVSAQSRNVPTTLMGWEVYPEALYHMLKKFHNYGIKKIIISENGSAFEDKVIGKNVHDEERINFLKANLEQALRAKKEGVNLTGYFVWTLTDNFEWAEGYRPTFGLVHVNFKSQERMIKDSGYWYQGFLQNLNPKS
jgi:beta-glucosidase